MVVRGYFEDEAYEYKDGGYVAVSETKDGYWFIMSKPTSKDKAELQIKMGVPRGEVGKVVTIDEAKKHGKIIGKEYLEHGGMMAKGGNVEDELYVYEYQKGQWTIKDKKNPRAYYTLSSKRENAENVRQELIDNPSRLKYYRTNEYAQGGVTEKEVVESNAEMVLSKIKEVHHHADELGDIVTNKSDIEAWVVAKIERASTDLSDITHYLDGQHEKMSMGGSINNYVHKMDKK
jgi:hypothetical protein